MGPPSPAGAAEAKGPSLRAGKWATGLAGCAHRHVRGQHRQRSRRPAGGADVMQVPSSCCCHAPGAHGLLAGLAVLRLQQRLALQQRGARGATRLCHAAARRAVDDRAWQCRSHHLALLQAACMAGCKVRALVWVSGLGVCAERVYCCTVSRASCGTSWLQLADTWSLNKGRTQFGRPCMRQVPVSTGMQSMSLSWLLFTPVALPRSPSSVQA